MPPPPKLQPRKPRPPMPDRPDVRRRKRRLVRMTASSRRRSLARLGPLDVVSALVAVNVLVHMLVVFASLENGWGMQRTVFERYAFQAYDMPLPNLRGPSTAERVCADPPVSQLYRDEYIRVFCTDRPRLGPDPADRWAVFGQFDWSGLLPHMFLHAGVWHLWANMAVLAALGTFVAPRLGTVRFLALYLGCGVGGAVAFWAVAGVNWAGLVPPIPWGNVWPWSDAPSWTEMFPTRGPGIPMVGASGAIAGLLAPFLVNRYHALRQQGHVTARYGFVAFVVASETLLVALHVAVAALGLPIAWEAHGGGFVAGLALEPLLRRSPAAYRAALRGT